MQKLKVITITVFTVGILLVTTGITISFKDNFKIKDSHKEEISTKDFAASASMIFQNKKEKNSILTPVKMQTSTASLLRVEVYDGLTLEELADKLNRNLGNDYIAGKGYLIASECLSRGVDPYIAVAIMLHETGCSSRCSSLTRSCNNVGGQKGSPGCNGGSYQAFATLDEGIVGFIANLEKNYFKVGLTTIDTIGPRYAESTTWPERIHAYVNKIRAS